MSGAQSYQRQGNNKPTIIQLDIFSTQEKDNNKLENVNTQGRGDVAKTLRHSSASTIVPLHTTKVIEVSQRSAKHIAESLDKMENEDAVLQRIITILGDQTSPATGKSYISLFNAIKGKWFDAVRGYWRAAGVPFPVTDGEINRQIIKQLIEAISLYNPTQDNFKKVCDKILDYMFTCSERLEEYISAETRVAAKKKLKKKFLKEHRNAFHSLVGKLIRLKDLILDPDRTPEKYVVHKSVKPVQSFYESPHERELDEEE